MDSVNQGRMHAKQLLACRCIVHYNCNKRQRRGGIMHLFIIAYSLEDAMYSLHHAKLATVLAHALQLLNDVATAD